MYKRQPVGFTVNDSASYFYVKNLQGDVRAIVDKTGAEKVSYVYDAYGQIVSMTGDEMCIRDSLLLSSV